MKPVDSVALKKRKSMSEGNNEKIDKFEMDIIYEGALNTAL